MREATSTAAACRDAREADLARIVAIYNEAIPGRLATADTEPVSVAGRLPWFREHTPARRLGAWLRGEDGSTVAPGVYLVRAKIAGQTWNRRVVVTR